MKLECFKTIEEEVEAKIEVKKSIFIAHLLKVENMDDVDLKLADIRKKYKDATHNVPAYRFYDKGSSQYVERFSDDGEPSGTSGKPMLDVLKYKELVNVMVVVTRYFGGTLLGTGGLVKAYTDALKNVLDNANEITVQCKKKYQIKTTYEMFSNIKNKLKQENIDVCNVSYGVDVSFDIFVLENIEVAGLLYQFEDYIIIDEGKDVYVKDE